MRAHIHCVRSNKHTRSGETVLLVGPVVVENHVRRALGRLLRGVVLARDVLVWRRWLRARNDLNFFKAIPIANGRSVCPDIHRRKNETCHTRTQHHIHILISETLRLTSGDVETRVNDGLLLLLRERVGKDHYAIGQQELLQVGLLACADKRHMYMCTPHEFERELCEQNRLETEKSAA